MRTTSVDPGTARSCHGTGAATGSSSPSATVTAVPGTGTIPAASGAAVAADTPGVVVTATPSAASAAISSAAREHTNRSPLFNRTTWRPSAAWPASSSAMRSVGHAGPSGVRPT